MIELKNVSKFYPTKSGKKWVLRDVSLTLPRSNIGILGRNGAGKSTLLRMLGKIEFPTSGKIESSSSFSWPLALSGGFVGNMTGKANVKFVCRLYGLSQEETNNVIAFVRAFSELGDYYEMPIKKYSSGMRSRLGFGLSLAFDFDYVLIDETLSVGDARFRQKAKNALLKKIEKSNALIVSHDMKTLQELCRCGILLHNEKLHYFEDIAEAIKRYQEINQKGT